MANWRAILNTVQTDVATQLATLSPTPTVGVGWPPITTLQLVSAKNQPVVSVYDHGNAADTTRWLPLTLNLTTVPTPGITSAFNVAQINPAQEAFLTITGAPNPKNGDAISLVVNGIGTVYVTQTGDTATTVATGLAAAINADLSAYITASSAGAVVTLTNASAVVENLVSNVGASGAGQLEVRRAKRRISIVLWASTANQRDQIGDLIESRLAYLQAYFGYQFSDGTYGRVTFESDVNLEENILQDTYRRDFDLGLEYGVLYADELYTVLAGQGIWQFTPQGIP